MDPSKARMLDFFSPSALGDNGAGDECRSITRSLRLRGHLCGGVRTLEDDGFWIETDSFSSLRLHESIQIIYNATPSADPNAWNGLDLHVVSAKQLDIDGVLDAVREEERKGAEEMKADLARAAEAW